MSGIFVPIDSTLFNAALISGVKCQQEVESQLFLAIFAAHSAMIPKQPASQMGLKSLVQNTLKYTKIRIKKLAGLFYIFCVVLWLISR